MVLDRKVDLLSQKVESDFQLLNKTLSTLNGSVSNLSVCLQEHKKQSTAELANFQTTVNSRQSSLAQQNGQLNNKLHDLSNELSFKLDTLNTSLSQHQQQTTAERAHLQTSVDSTHSKLDSLTATAAQLSFDHQEIQTNISDVQCMDKQHERQPQKPVRRLKII